MRLRVDDDRLMNFRKLVDTARAAGRGAHLRPRPIAWVVRRTGVSRAQIYNLIAGTQVATPWTAARIARGLKLDVGTVETALAKSRRECELTS